MKAAHEAIPTNLRLLLLMEEVAAAGTPVTPTEINARLNLPKPTIHRLFGTLEAQGFLQRELDGKSYSVGRRFRKMSANAISSLRIRTARLAVLTALAEKIGETCNLAMPERSMMIYIDRVETKWPLRIQLPIGTEVPFYCTASGKTHLSMLSPAHLARYLNAVSLEKRAPNTITDRSRLETEIEATRERGYGVDDEEYLEEMVAVAVPIRDDKGRLYSTLSFHAPKRRLQLSDAVRHVPLLDAAAAELSRLVLDPVAPADPEPAKRG